MTEIHHGGADVARWQRIHALFDAAADLDSAAQQALLDASCAEDPSIRAKVATLLAQDRIGDDPIEAALSAAAREALADDTGSAALPPPAVIGQYRIHERLGVGGMGEVYLADDTTLGRRVAIKLPDALHATDPDVRLQLQREARAAAGINHPHVCVVHEVGTAADGRPFIAMEYLEGETLAARLRRGALPMSALVRLGCEAASALVDAHALGVVHRDLKPSNIMLTSHGCKVLDFGLASVARGADEVDRAGAARLMGTWRYMSPEQAQGAPADHRTDLFSLGVVLYEAATGRRPFDGASPRSICEAAVTHAPPPPSRIARGLPAAFDRIVGRLLEKDPAARYQTAAALASDLSQIEIQPFRRRLWVPASILVMGLAGALALMGGFGGAAAPARTQATILVGAFANTTGNVAFDRTLREALVVQLQETPFLDVFPDANVRETLRLMSRTPDEQLSPPVAQEVAQRHGIEAIVAGAVAPSADGYVVRLVATNGRSGEVIAQAEAIARTQAEVLSGIGETVVRLREQLGESVASVQQFRTPVEQATTASMDALRAYALGMEQSSRGEYALAMTLYERAVQIDPDFALAHQALAGEALNAGHDDRAVPAATRAYELRRRVSEREAFRIVLSYHSTVTEDLVSAVAAARQWQRTYPLEWRPYHALGNLYLSMWNYTDAADAAREAVRLNPDVASAYSNLGGALFALGRFEDARKVYRDAMTRGYDAPEYHAFLWRIAYYTDDTEGMRHHLDWARTSASWARNMPSLVAALQGRWKEARAESTRARAFFDERGMSARSALVARYDSVAGALFGDCTTSRQEAARVLRTAGLPEERARVSLALALCGDDRLAASERHALALRHPQATNLHTVWLKLIDAANMLAEGRHDAAVEVLAAMRSHDGAAESLVVYLRGLALLASGAYADARSEFETVIARPGQAFWVPVVRLAQVGLARAAARAGDEQAASRAYQAVFTGWPDADADLPVLQQARREYAALASR